MTVDHAIRTVQMTYPQVYLACHTRHQRKRTTEHRISSRDASILAHLDGARPIAPAQLSRHMSIGRSTISEALKRLVALGFVTRADGSASVILSEKGIKAVRDTSVLEADRLAAALARVSDRDRLLICRGLERLALACRELPARRAS